MENNKFMISLGAEFSSVTTSLKAVEDAIKSFSKKMAAVPIVPNFEGKDSAAKAQKAFAEITKTLGGEQSVMKTMTARLGQDIETVMLKAGDSIKGFNSKMTQGLDSAGTMQVLDKLSNLKIDTQVATNMTAVASAMAKISRAATDLTLVLSKTSMDVGETFGKKVDISRISEMTSALSGLNASFRDMGSGNDGSDLKDFVGTLSLFINRIAGDFSKAGAANVTANVSTIKKALTAMVGMFDETSKFGVQGVNDFPLDRFGDITTGIQTLSTSLNKSNAAAPNWLGETLDKLKNSLKSFDDTTLANVNTKLQSIVANFATGAMDTAGMSELIGMLSQLNRLGTGNDKKKAPEEQVAALMTQFKNLQDFFVKAKAEIAKVEVETTAAVTEKAVEVVASKKEAAAKAKLAAAEEKTAAAAALVSTAMQDQVVPAGTVLKLVELQLEAFKAIHNVVTGITKELSGKQFKIIQTTAEPTATKATKTKKIDKEIADLKPVNQEVVDSLNAVTKAYRSMRTALVGYSKSLTESEAGTGKLMVSLVKINTEAKKFATAFTSLGLVSDKLSDDQMKKVVDSAVERMKQHVSALTKVQKTVKAADKKALAEAEARQAAEKEASAQLIATLKKTISNERRRATVASNKVEKLKTTETDAQKESRQAKEKAQQVVAMAEAEKKLAEAEAIRFKQEERVNAAKTKLENTTKNQKIVEANKLYRDQKELMGQIITLTKKLDSLPDGVARDKLKQDIELLKDKLVTQEKIDKKPKYIKEESDLRKMLATRMLYEAEMSALAEKAAAREQALVMANTVDPAAEAEAKKVAYQNQLNELYREQLGYISDIKKADAAINKTDKTDEKDALLKDIAYFEALLRTIESIKRAASGTDQDKYQKFDTSYRAGLIDVDKLRDNRVKLQDAETLKTLQGHYEGVTAAIKDFDSRIRNLSTDVAEKEANELRAKLDDLKTSAEQLHKGTPGLEAYFKKLKTAMGGIDKASKKPDADQIKEAENTLKSYSSAMSRITKRLLMQGLRTMFRDSVSFAKEFGEALNDIQIVTFKTAEEADALGDTYVQLAKDMKLTGVEVAKSAVALYRQGLNDQEVKARLTSAIQFAKVAAIEVEAAIDIITVAINTGMVKSAERATDVLVALGDAAATDKLIAA